MSDTEKNNLFENQVKFKSIYSGKSVAKNTIYNLLGYGLPLLFAIVLIPPLIKGLGEERFGILSLVWIVIGYFSFFDFGIGRTLTKIIAEKIGAKQTNEIPGIFWTSFYLIICFSLIGTIGLVFSNHYLVYELFNISKNLQKEVLQAFYILAISIPIVTISAGLRGTLEAYQKFAVISIIRIILGAFTFIVPVVCLIFTDNLVWIVTFLSLTRLIIFVLYLIQCFNLIENLKTKIKFDISLVKPIIRLSSWMTVSNLVGPLIIYLDRFLIGVLISAEAIAYYATPYEVITKLLLIPAAIVGVLFPAFSATYLSDRNFSEKLFNRGVKYSFVIIFPIILFIIFFSSEGLNIWLGSNFVVASSFILKILCIGVLINSLAHLPFSLLQGIGRPDIVSKLQLIELPIFISLLFVVTKNYGINGVVMVWLFRIVVDAILLFFVSKGFLKFKFDYLIIVLICFSILTLSFPFFIDNLFARIISITIFYTIFVLLVWNYLLVDEEKNFFINKLKDNIKLMKFS